jgi:hypothetical protein
MIGKRLANGGDDEGFGATVELGDEVGLVEFEVGVAVAARRFENRARATGDGDGSRKCGGRFRKT